MNREYFEREVGIYGKELQPHLGKYSSDRYILPVYEDNLSAIVGDPCRIPTTKEIQIKQYGYKCIVKEGYTDILTYRMDELGNLISKEWTRRKNLTEEKEMQDISHYMGKVSVGDLVVYLNKSTQHTNYVKNKAIWKLVSYTDGWNDRAVLENIGDIDRTFETDVTNLIKIQHIGNLKNIVTEKSYSTLIKQNTNKTEDNKMNRNKTMLERTTDANLKAAKIAAAITAGRTINNVVASKITPKLPMFVKGYADTPLGRVVMANVIDFAVKQYMPNNAKANYASDSAMQAAMTDFLAEFDVESMLEDIMSGVVIPEEVADNE